MIGVVVVGRDAALWLSALALAHGLRAAGVVVTAVELPSALTDAAVYATSPSLEALHERIGLNEADVLRGCGGAYSLGQRYVGDGADPFLTAWGSIGAPIAGEPFLPTWTKARAHGLSVPLADFCPTAAAALYGRMLVPDDRTTAFGRTDYGYHLPARAYVAGLRKVAARAGVVSLTSDTAVAHWGDAGIAAIGLDDGLVVTGDLFVAADWAEYDTRGDGDTTAAMATGDRLLSARAPGFAEPPPYAELRAGPTGWTGLYPTRAETGVRHLFSAALTSDAEALAAATAAAGLPLDRVTVTALKPAPTALPWRDNCIAIGTAAGAGVPMAGLDLAVVQLGIVHLLSLFPAGPDWAAERAEYNRILTSALARLGDWQAAAYALAPWPGPFWDRARTTTVSPELAHKLATFRARGEIAPFEDESVQPDDWVQLLVGLGVTPESWPPTIDRIHGDAMKAGFRSQLSFVREIVLAQPSHRAALADLSGAGG